MRSALLLLLLAAPVFASPLLDRARRDLQRGRLVEVLTTLRDEGPVPPAERVAAGRLLGTAHAQALKKGQPELALQLAEAAFEKEPAQATVLSFLAGEATGDGRYAQARRYVEIWRALFPKDSEAVGAARARIEEGERSAGSLWAQARRLAAGATGKGGASSAGSGAGVVLYGASWCGACRAAKQWLRAKAVPFVERDVEGDASARAEKVEKARAAGVNSGGIPLLDARGTILVGFSPDAYARALGL